MKRTAVAMIWLVVLGGCSAEQTRAPGPRVRAASVRLEKFDSCLNLLTYLREESIKQMGPYGFGGFGRGGLIAEDSASSSGAVESRASAPSAQAQVTDHSTTNVQERGVDEPDLMKTDGKRMFVTAGQSIHALDVSAGAARKLGAIAFENSYDNQLLLVGDRLIAVGGGSIIPMGGPADSRIAMSFPAGFESTRVRVIDVSNPAAMKVTSTLQLQGTYVSARLIDGIARLVVRSSAEPRVAMRFPTSESDVKQARDANTAAIQRSTIDQWLPTYTLERPGQPKVDGAIATCDTTYRPEPFSGLGFTSVLTLDPANPEPKPSATITSDSQTVYSSTQRLYVTTTKWQNQGMPVPLADSATQGKSVATPTAAPAYEPPSTAVHAFDITDTSKATYLGSGKAAGTVLSQWSLSEHNGMLRVATTVDDASGRGNGESQVAVFALRGGALTEIGKVGGLGKGERIFAVRFIDDVGYVVTFRQTDPLYVIDLREPARPKVTGELKIPGYSAYLHPIGDGFLLGVGQDATDTGRTTGTQVAIFDVRDPAAPKRVQQLQVGGQSEAEFDHHAFLYWAKSKLAIIPAQSWGPGNFAGAVALHVDSADPLKERGRISHPRTAPIGGGGVSPSDMKPTEPGVEMVAPEQYDAPIRRSAVVGSTIFTISDAGVQASDLATLAQRGWLAF